jgi:GT2 family glycosyltransferase
MDKKLINKAYAGDLIAVITINYNQSAFSLAAINSLLTSSYKNIQVYLIDNGSCLIEKELIRKELPDDFRLYYFDLYQNLGYVGGINYGLSEALKNNPDYFLIINNDILIDSNAINQLYRCIQTYQNHAIITGKVFDYIEKNKLQFVGAQLINKKSLQYKYLGVGEYDSGQFNEVAERDMIDDIFWLFPSELYTKIGGYSDHFWFNGESADFALRAVNAGYKLIYTPEAKLWHKGSPSVGGKENNPAKTYWIVQSYLIFRYKHLNKQEFFKLFLTFGIKLCILFCIALFSKTSSFKNWRAKFAAYRYVFGWLITQKKNKGRNPFLKLPK